MIDIYKIISNKVTVLVLTGLIATSCALSVPFYERPNNSSAREHFTYKPESLNCMQLSQQVIRAQNVLSDIASRVTEEANRNTASFSAGIRTNNPRRGSNFIGMQSSAVDPAVLEFEKAMLLLEELQVLMVDKCSSPASDEWTDQPTPKG
tara:strand:+ start:116 stop:565 length:450 start_codon:yes stop_codon:yes gene_type:complete